MTTQSTDLTVLINRLQVLEDKNAITEHTARYNECWDDARLDEWVATWTEDGVFHLTGAPDTVGREALHRMITAMTSVGFVHMTLNPQIWVEGDTARQHATVLLGARSQTHKPDTSKWVTTGRYVDTLQRTSDGWGFARREFAPDASLRGLPKWW